MSADPIGRLARGAAGRAPVLATRHLAAADRLRTDFASALAGPRLSTRYEPRLETRAAGAPDEAFGVEARRRLDRALYSVGEDARAALVRVVLEERGLEDLESEQGWPRRSGKIIVRMALDALAGHYGM